MWLVATSVISDQCLDMLSILFMWAIITHSEIRPGVQLNIEVMTPFGTKHGLQTSLHLDSLSPDGSGKEVSSCLIGNIMESAEIGVVSLLTV